MVRRLPHPARSALPEMFLCFIPPKLMMLRRLAENVTGSSASQAQAVDMDRARRWWGGGRGGPDGLRRRALLMMFRAMAAAVVVCSVTGMVALDSCVPPAQEHLLGIA